MDVEQERKRFEEAMSKQIYWEDPRSFDRLAPGSFFYKDEITHWAWVAWENRAALAQKEGE